MRVRTTRPTGLLAIVALAAAAAAPVGVHSEESGTSRQVVQCDIGGEIVYTDLSCAEAHRIAFELSPEYRARQFARRDSEPVAPASGDGANRIPAEPSTATHQVVALGLSYISPALGRNAECPHLEQRMALVEAEARSATAIDAIRLAEERLEVQRTWHRELGC